MKKLPKRSIGLLVLNGFFQTAGTSPPQTDINWLDQQTITCVSHSLKNLGLPSVTVVYYGLLTCLPRIRLLYNQSGQSTYNSIIPMCFLGGSPASVDRCYLHMLDCLSYFTSSFWVPKKGRICRRLLNLIFPSRMSREKWAKTKNSPWKPSQPIVRTKSLYYYAY